MYSCKVLVLTVAVMLLSLSAQANLLENGDMETHEGWQRFSDIRYEGWSARTGTNGLAMYGWCTFGTAYQEILTSGASNYTFSAWGYKDADFNLSNLTVTLKIQYYYDTDGTNLLGAVTNHITSAAAAWNQYSVTATTPFQTRMIRATMRFSGDASAGAFKWDDADLSSTPITSVTHYVSYSGSHTPPYTSWATAANDIQSAIHAAGDGDYVVVTNGVYNTGGATANSYLITNRVALTNAIIVTSVNGPDHTSIVGQGPISDTAIRCAYVGATAELIGFTLTNGHTMGDYNEYFEERAGGGVYAEKTARLTNCVITHCNADNYSGGGFQGHYYNCKITHCFADYGVAGIYRANAYGSELSFNEGGAAENCTLINCFISDNEGYYGAGAENCNAYNCVFVRNHASQSGGAVSGGDYYNCTMVNNHAGYLGGGAAGGDFFNCILYYNTADKYQDNVGWSVRLSHSCVQYIDPSSNTCFSTPPGLAGLSNPRLLPTSPCINAGTNDDWMASSLDMDGHTRLVGNVDIGAYEYVPGLATGAMNLAVIQDQTRSATQTPIHLVADLEGLATSIVWTIEGTNTYDVGGLDYSFALTGNQQVVLGVYNEDGYIAVTTAVEILDYITHVVSGGSTPTPPYDTWATAATTLQDAVSASYFGGRVMVSNGTYGSSTVYTPYTLPCRVAITNQIVMCSVNGPEFTTIQGGGALGPTAIRCAYVGARARMEGFTFTGGHTRTNIYEDSSDRQGAGASIGFDAVISNCVAEYNHGYRGGGLSGGHAYNCLIQYNTSVYDGGGAANTDLDGCLIRENVAHSGGGTYMGNVVNCVIVNNDAQKGNGGGTSYGNIYNCTIAGNSAYSHGGGCYDGVIRNCIMYYNTAGVAGENYSWFYYNSPNIQYSCYTPNNQSMGDITNAPMFASMVGGDYRLSAGSPCIDAGSTLTNSPVDYYGVPRPLDGDEDGYAYPDMGAFEFMSATTDTDGDGLTDTNECYVYATDPRIEDCDDDGMLDGAEAKAGTDPWDDASRFVMETAETTNWQAGGIEIKWSSVAGHDYTVWRSTNLVNGFSVLSSNLSATAPLNVYTDTTAVAEGTFIYRIEVE